MYYMLKGYSTKRWQNRGNISENQKSNIFIFFYNTHNSELEDPAEMVSIF